MVMLLGIIIHLAILPWLDLTLAAANSPLAIVVNIGLSVWLLGETFSCKYDCTAISLIIAGSFTIVLLSNKEQIEYEGDDLLNKLKTPKAIVFYIAVVLLYIAIFSGLNKFQLALRDFETDADLADFQTRKQEPVDETKLIFKPDSTTEDIMATDDESEI